jgi:hypothetical protein
MRSWFWFEVSASRLSPFLKINLNAKIRASYGGPRNM